MITRIEIIDRIKGGGRVYVNWDIQDCWVSIQDEGRTMKVFINEEGINPPEIKKEL